MTENKFFTIDEIREYWVRQSEKYGVSHEASWSDRFVIEKEIEEISRYLCDDDKVLDVGCANGYSTIQWASRKHVQIKGVDYIPGMIENAQRHLSILADKLVGNVCFKQGNILFLNEDCESYDKVIVVRVIINLGTWEQQVKGILECVRVLKSEGLLLMSEATIQGWQKMNSFRMEWGLDNIQIPLFNCYLDEDKIIDLLSPKMDLMDIINFSSTYYVGTRVLKPIVARLLGMEEKVVDPCMNWNRWFAQLPAYGDYGTQKLFVFKKK